MASRARASADIPPEVPWAARRQIEQHGARVGLAAAWRWPTLEVADVHRNAIELQGGSSIGKVRDANKQNGQSNNETGRRHITLCYATVPYATLLQMILTAHQPTPLCVHFRRALYYLPPAPLLRTSLQKQTSRSSPWRSGACRHLLSSGCALHSIGSYRQDAGSSRRHCTCRSLRASAPCGAARVRGPSRGTITINVERGSWAAAFGSRGVSE